MQSTSIATSFIYKSNLWKYLTSFYSHTKQTQTNNISYDSWLLLNFHGNGIFFLSIMIPSSSNFLDYLPNNWFSLKPFYPLRIWDWEDLWSIKSLGYPLMIYLSKPFSLFRGFRLRGLCSTSLDFWATLAWEFPLP